MKKDLVFLAGKLYTLIPRTDGPGFKTVPVVTGEVVSPALKGE